MQVWSSDNASRDVSLERGSCETADHAKVCAGGVLAGQPDSLQIDSFIDKQFINQRPSVPTNRFLLACILHDIKQCQHLSPISHAQQTDCLNVYICVGQDMRASALNSYP